METSAAPSELSVGDGVNRELAAMATLAGSQNSSFPAQNPNIIGNDLGLVMTALIQQQGNMGGFPAAISVPNAIQPSLVQQLPNAYQLAAINCSVQPVAIPAQIQTEPLQQPMQQVTIAPLSIPLQTEILTQNLIVQQQQQQQQRLHFHQLQQQEQLQLNQLQQVQQQQQQLQLHQLQQQFPIVTIPQQISVVPSPIIHNLIPEHLRASSLAAPMNGTTGYAPALILPHNTNYINDVNMALLSAASAGNTAAAVAVASQLNASLGASTLPVVPSIPLTVQDRCSISPPVFNGVNLSYPGVEPLGVDPPIYLVHNFLTHAECDFLIHAANDVWQPAPVVGKGSGEISPSRTSSTSFLAREDLPDYMRKVSALTSKPIEHCELPQVGRYLPSQQYKHVSSDIVLRLTFVKNLLLGSD